MYLLLASHQDCQPQLSEWNNHKSMGSNTSEQLFDFIFLVTRTVAYMPTPSYLYPLTICSASKGSHNIVNGAIPHQFITTQVNNDQLTCCTIARCHTVLVLTPIEKQSGQQLLSACHLTCLNGLNISCYPINTSHVQQQFDSS